MVLHIGVGNALALSMVIWALIYVFVICA